MKLEEITTLAVRQFCSVARLDEESVRKRMVIRCVGENCAWIEFYYKEQFFRYNRKRQYI